LHKTSHRANPLSLGSRALCEVSLDLLVVGHSGFTAINRNAYVQLKARGWQVELAIPQALPDFPARRADPRRAEDPPIHWVELKGTNQRFWCYQGLAAVLQTRRPRAILLEGDPASVLALQLSRWARPNAVPLLCYTNENNLAPFTRSLGRRDIKAAARSLRSLILGSFTRKAVAHVFVLSDAGVVSMNVLRLGDRVSKMPLGFDPTVFHPDLKARERIRATLSLGGVVIAYVGRIVPGKGIEILLDALEKVTDLNWHFLVDDLSGSSPSPYADQIQKRMAANPVLLARIRWFHADHYEIADYMNAADILVAPSCLPEQYGRVLAEAMACGKVVIASDAGAYPELVSDCGVIVPRGDAQAFANALRLVLIDSPFRRELGRKAAARAVQALSMDVQVRIIDERLKKVLPPARIL
jgi:glycosyltransferase involved in cell wall biosynthesis